MKVITLKQPWATLLVYGYKGPETRGWSTTFRGRILIHASAKFDKADKELCSKYPFNIFIPQADKLPLGAIIGECTIDDVITTEKAKAMLLNGSPHNLKLHFGDYSPGRFAWLVSRCKSYPNPIPAKGALSLWEFPDPTMIMPPKK